MSTDDVTTPDTTDERAARLAARADEGRRIGADELRRRTRRSLLTGALGIAAGGVAWNRLQTGPVNDNIPQALRSGFNFNNRVWTALPTTPVAREFPTSAREQLRVNGTRGMDEEIDLDAWTMTVQDDSGTVVDEFDLAVILDLPQVDRTFEHKCIEGWSTIAHWTGPRFADLAARYDRAVTDTRYVSFQTPDAGYYVGLEMDRAMHPQTLLAHQLNGEALTQDHGAPLRLYTPNNYGIKSLKRIGLVQFTNTRPADYWAERGYDWYSEF